MMEITRVKEVEPGKNPHSIESKKIYDHDNALAFHIMLKPGESRARKSIPAMRVVVSVRGEIC